MNYDSKRALALRLITKFGGVCSLLRQVTKTTDAPAWRGSRGEETITGVGFVLFDDDGETFLNHNIVGNTRIALLAPDDRISDVSIGDRLILPTKEVVTVDKIKRLDPDTTGAILWTLLVH